MQFFIVTRVQYVHTSVFVRTGGGWQYPSDREDVNHFVRKHVRISCEINKQIIMIHSSSSSAVRDKSKKTKVLDMEQRDSPCQ